MQEEPEMTLPNDFGGEDEMKTEERKAMEAIRKFTDEDDDDLGEISVKSILGGDFLMSKFMIKQIMFVIFCVALMLVYTGNRYDSQQDAILIDSLRERLQEVKYNVLTQSSELMNLTRQSNVEKRLRNTPDSLLHNSITPPYLIKAGGRTSKAEDEEIEEVLVDSADLPAQMDETEDEEAKPEKEKSSEDSEGQGAQEPQKPQDAQAPQGAQKPQGTSSAKPSGE